MTVELAGLNIPLTVHIYMFATLTTGSSTQINDAKFTELHEIQGMEEPIEASINARGRTGRTSRMALFSSICLSSFIY